MNPDQIYRPDELAQEMADVAHALHGYVRTRLFPMIEAGHACNYGAAFAAASELEIAGKETAFLGRCLEFERRQPRDPVGFHWQFNNYALQKVDERVPGLLSDERRADLRRIKKHWTLNWTLLGQLVALSDPDDLANDVGQTIPNMQHDCGFLPDTPGSRSLQYHAFSGALAAEAAQRTDSTELQSVALKAAAFSLSTTPDSGMPFLLGRGQNQIFGLGPLLFLFGYAARETRRADYRTTARKIVACLKCNQRDDGSIPLVIGRIPVEPGEVQASDRPPGWYLYNTLCDYLPFTVFQLLRASKIWAAPPATDQTGLPPATSGKSFLKHGQNGPVRHYWSAPSPDGDVDDQMPLPHLQFDNGPAQGGALTALTGGESGWNGVNDSSVSLPGGVLKGWPSAAHVAHRHRRRLRRQGLKALLRTLWVVPKDIEVWRDCRIQDVEDGFTAAHRLFSFDRKISAHENGIDWQDEIRFTRSCVWQTLSLVRLMIPAEANRSGNAWHFERHGLRMTIACDTDLATVESFRAPDADYVIATETHTNMSVSRGDHIRRNGSISWDAAHD